MRTTRKRIVFGTGHVGMSLAVLPVQHNEVSAFDIDEAQVELVNQAKSVFVDKKIEQYLSERELSLTATRNKKQAYQGAEIIVDATPADYESETSCFETSSVAMVTSNVFELIETAAIIIKSNVPADFGWSDVGGWYLVAGAHQADKGGSSSVGNDKMHFIDPCNTHTECTSHTEKVIAAIGVDNLVIIDTRDESLLVCRTKSQDVKLVVEALKVCVDPVLTEKPAFLYRPWSTCATVEQEGGHQVKRISVAPGQTSAYTITTNAPCIGW